MELEAITAWLASDQPYAQGAALYARLGSSRTYLRLFALQPTEYSQQVLVRELQALVATVREEVAMLVPSPPEAPATPAFLAPAPDPADVNSPVLAQIKAQLRAVRDERSHAHPQLTARNVGKKARLVTALRILELTDLETKLKGAESHVLEYGRLPGPVASADVTDAGVLRQRLTNLLSNRSKLKKNPARADDLAAAEAEIILIRSKLNS